MKKDLNPIKNILRFCKNKSIMHIINKNNMNSINGQGLFSKNKSKFLIKKLFLIISINSKVLHIINFSILTVHFNAVSAPLIKSLTNLHKVILLTLNN